MRKGENDSAEYVPQMTANPIKNRRRGLLPKGDVCSIKMIGLTERVEGFGREVSSRSYSPDLEP